MSKKAKVNEIYPGVRAVAAGVTDAVDKYKKAPLNPLLGFELETYQIPIEDLQPSKRVADGVITTRKFKQIVSSIEEIGLIEPLSIVRLGEDDGGFLLLDGHLRAMALKQLERGVAPCLISIDDETYTYNHRINRLSTIQEHYMIRRAIDRGVSKERLAKAFDVNLSSINRRLSLLDGICPKAVELLKDRQFTPGLSRFLRKMKAARQVEAVELMVAGDSFTEAHAAALLKATKPDQRSDYVAKKTKKEQVPIERIVKLEKEMDKVQEQYQSAEESYGSDLLQLTAARGYIRKLLNNKEINQFLVDHDAEILSQLNRVLENEAAV